MANSNLVQLIKQIAMDAFTTSKPCNYCIGTVVSDNPLQIKVSQNIILDEDFLLLSRNVTNYEVEIETDSVTYKCEIRNELKKEEKVLMIRGQGGNEYAVIDRVVD